MWDLFFFGRIQHGWMVQWPVGGAITVTHFHHPVSHTQTPTAPRTAYYANPEAWVVLSVMVRICGYLTMCACSDSKAEATTTTMPTTNLR